MNSFKWFAIFLQTKKYYRMKIILCYYTNLNHTWKIHRKKKSLKSLQTSTLPRELRVDLVQQYHSPDNCRFYQLERFSCIIKLFLHR